TFFYVEQNNFVYNVFLRHHVSACSTHVPCTNYYYFHSISYFMLCGKISKECILNPKIINIYIPDYSSLKNDGAYVTRFRKIFYYRGYIPYMIKVILFTDVYYLGSERYQCTL